MAITLESLDPAFFKDRLQFSYIENPAETRGTGNDREYKEFGEVRLVNTGPGSVTVTGVDLDGPFRIVSPASLAGTSVPAGGALTVRVAFDRAQYAPPTGSTGAIDNASTIFEGRLQVLTNNAATPSLSVNLAGFWQLVPEGGMEPNINEIWDVFGFGNVLEGLPTKGAGGRSLLSDNGVYSASDATEVLSPYWKLAPGVTEAKFTQLAAYHGPGGATVEIHAPDNDSAVVRLWRGAADDNQQLAPNAGTSTTVFATSTVNAARIPDSWPGSDVFGIKIAAESSDPRLNEVGTKLVDVNGIVYTIRAPGKATDESGQFYDIDTLDLVQQGHRIRMYQALDSNGVAIPNVYLAAMDYGGVNSDYNDNLLVIEGIAPAEYGPPINVGGARLAIGGLDDAAADDRLVFSSVTVPDTSASTVALGGQEFRDDATITLSNSGTSSLSILELSLSGPGAAGFQIVGAPTAIAAGGSANVTIRFIGVDPTTDDVAVRYAAALTVRTNAAVDATQVIDLAGLAQRRSELGQEATAADIVAAFGYTTNVAQAQLRNGGIVETVGDEVLAPYFQRLDGSRPVEIIQMAAFLGQDDVSRLGFHGLDSATTTFLFAQDDQQGQTVSPDGHVAGPGDTGSVARGVINSDAPFGIRIAVDGRPTFAGWSDPVANRVDPALDEIVGADRGHLIRYFVARDADGAVIPGTYIGLQDYAGGVNFDYNDHVFLIRNVRPHALSAAEDADRDGVNDALERDGDGDGTVDFFDFDIPTGGQSAFNGTGTPWQVGPSAAFSLLARQFDNGGQGVAYSDTSSRKLGDVSARPDAGVDISATSGAVAHTQAGEWLEYTLNVAAAGDYALSFEAATPNAGRSIIATFARHGAVYETAAADVVDSGSYGVFVETAAEVVTLRAGVQVLRVAFNAGGQDLRDINLVAVDLLV